jgi:predicted TIM-barrel fold metal-dependent hydrolase
MKLFDSSVHPTVSGKWLRDGIDTSFKSLTQHLDEGQISRACALGLHGVGDYDHVNFMQACRRDERLVPIAGVHPKFSSRQELEFLSQLGFRGVKLHPTLGGYPISNPDLISLSKIAGDLNLVVFLCTYDFANRFRTGAIDVEVSQVVDQCPSTSFVLMHSGGTRILDFVELARSRQNVLLDLSFSALKFRNSSVQNDIEFAFQTMPHRLCIGSDFPDFSPSDLRSWLGDQCADFGEMNLTRVCFDNLASFLSLEGEYGA